MKNDMFKAQNVHAQLRRTSHEMNTGAMGTANGAEPGRAVGKDTGGQPVLREGTDPKNVNRNSGKGMIFTREELIKGFKMGVILGQPRSKTIARSRSGFRRAK